MNPIYFAPIPDAIRRLSSHVPVETKRKAYLATRQATYDMLAISFRAEMDGKRRWPQLVAYVRESHERM